MDKCPYEILLQIFQLACNDDGTTGRSLSMVSRNVNFLSRECKLQSVAVTGVQKLVPFAAMLGRLQACDRRIRHIFISTMSQHRSPLPSTLATYSGEIVYDEIWSTYTHIIQMISPTIETCTLVNHFPRITTLLPVSCPNLMELKLQGPFPILPYPYEIPSFPSLRSVTFSSFPSHPVHLFDDIAIQAPSAEELAFFPSQPSRCLARELASALDIPLIPVLQPSTPSSKVKPAAAFTATDAGPTTLIPPSVSLVVIQPGPFIDSHHPNSRCLTNVQHLMLKKIKFMEKNDKKHRLRVVNPTEALADEWALLHWLR